MEDFHLVPIGGFSPYSLNGFSPKILCLKFCWGWAMEKVYRINHRTKISEEHLAVVETGSISPIRLLAKNKYGREREIYDVFLI
jgi:hypothetical protein